MRDRKRVDPDGKGGGKKLGKIEGGEIETRIHYVRKKIYLQLKNSQNEKEEE